MNYKYYKRFFKKNLAQIMYVAIPKNAEICQIMPSFSELWNITGDYKESIYFINISGLIEIKLEEFREIGKKYELFKPIESPISCNLSSD